MAGLYDLARMTSATVGTGTTITLGVNVSGYLSFANAGVPDGAWVTYAVADPALSATASEIGRGIYNSTTLTITRSVILFSTNSNNAINLSGTEHIFITAAAEDILPVTSIQRQATALQWRYLGGVPIETFISVSDQPWMIRTWMDYVWAGLIGVAATGMVRIDPVTGAVTTLSTGAVGTSEIRGICGLGQYIWCCDRLGGKVFRIDRNNTLQGTITGFTVGGAGQGPFGITTDGTFLYVCETITGAGRVSKINPANVTLGGTVTRAVALATAPNSVNIVATDCHNPAWDGGSKIWVPSLSTTTLSLIDTSGMTVTTKTVASGGAWGTFWDGIHMNVSEITNDFLHRFPTGTTGFESQIPMPGSSGIADMARIGTDLYVALSTYLNPDGTTGAVGIVDARLGQLTGVIYAGTHVASLDTWGPYVFVTDTQSNRVIRLLASNRA